MTFFLPATFFFTYNRATRLLDWCIRQLLRYSQYSYSHSSSCIRLKKNGLTVREPKKNRVKKEGKNVTSHKDYEMYEGMERIASRSALCQRYSRVHLTRLVFSSFSLLCFPFLPSSLCLIWKAVKQLPRRWSERKASCPIHSAHSYILTLLFFFPRAPSRLPRLACDLHFQRDALTGPSESRPSSRSLVQGRGSV